MGLFKTQDDNKYYVSSVRLFASSFIILSGLKLNFPVFIEVEICEIVITSFFELVSSFFFKISSLFLITSLFLFLIFRRSTASAYRL